MQCFFYTFCIVHFGQCSVLSTSVLPTCYLLFVLFFNHSASPESKLYDHESINYTPVLCIDKIKLLTGPGEKSILIIKW